MSAQRDVIQAAQAMRPYLPELLDASVVTAFAQRLEQLLAQSAQTQDDQAVRELLGQQEATREWLRLYLEERRPAAEILKVLRTYHPLPGKSGAIASPRYRCPVASCNRVWYRRQVEDAVPNCPIHGIQMVRDSKTVAE